MPKVLFIIAPKNFRDEELFDTQKVLEDNGIETHIASTEKKEIIGKLGGKAVSEFDFSEVKAEDFDAVSVIGGPGAPDLANYPEFYDVLHDFKDQNKLITAICIAPTLLAQAGLLKDKKSTVWNGDGKQSEVLEKYGATFIDDPVVGDGDTITGNGPGAAKDFGLAIMKALS